MSMSVAERKLVTEVWVKAAKSTKQHLMIQIGGAPLPDVIELVSTTSIDTRYITNVCVCRIIFNNTIRL